MNRSRNRAILIFVALAAPASLGLAARASAPPAPQGDRPVDPDVAALAEGNSAFAFDLYRRLRDGGDTNLFFSPSSISTALAMTSAGARGRTAEEMAKVLHFGLPPDRLHPAFAALNAAEEGGTPAQRGYELNVANRLWGQKGFHFLPEFLAVTRDNYGAELAVVDFKTQAEASRLAINEWVEQQTRGKIKDLIPPRVIDDLTRLVLTNAIYFKGTWTSPFIKKATKDAPFFMAPGREVVVPLMVSREPRKYLEADGMKLLELPYGKGKGLSMLVFLPDAKDGLGDLELRLSQEQVDKWIAGLRMRQVEVFLPRFRIETQFQLGKLLQAMGMVLAFDPASADFSGMSTDDELAITEVVHKAFVDVNEEGTEAAAATGVAVGARSAAPPSEPAVFRADHPFAFLIRDNRSGSILFLGRLVNPKG
jgi:serpin B